MYRSFKMGRKSGSLSEDRVTSLLEIGFQFREDLSEAEHADA